MWQQVGTAACQIACSCLSSTTLCFKTCVAQRVLQDNNNIQTFTFSRAIPHPQFGSRLLPLVSTKFAAFADLLSVSKWQPSYAVQHSAKVLPMPSGGTPGCREQGVGAVHSHVEALQEKKQGLQKTLEETEARLALQERTKESVCGMRLNRGAGNDRRCR